MTIPFRQLSATPSVDRIRQRYFALDGKVETASAVRLLLAVVQDESLGGGCLRRLGVTEERLVPGCTRAMSSSVDGKMSGESDAGVERIFDRAVLIARQSDSAGELSSEHLVEALATVPGPAQDQLSALGVSHGAVMQALGRHELAPVALAVDFELNAGDQLRNRPFAWSEQSSTSEGGIMPAGDDSLLVLPLIDANLNRAREGLRVLEDYARFIARDVTASEALKELRHDLVAAELRLRNGGADLQAARDVQQDVGTDITTSAEMKRATFADVCTANARRVQESLRSLEEFGKTICSRFAAEIKSLRYRAYEAEQMVAGSWEGKHGPSNVRIQRLGLLNAAQLYVLVTEALCRQPWQVVVQEVLEGGAQVIQLREKHLSEEELLRRTNWIADACHEAGVLCILNDDADVVAASRADGVHIGQDDGAPAKIRQRIGRDCLVGISTHDASQLLAANRLGDYLGVGPVFETGTKSFEKYAGLEFVRLAAEQASKPWFAIGGITKQNLATVCDNGASAVAVSSSVIGSEDPGESARQMRAILAQSNTI